MGEDSVTPFLSVENKWVIILGLTSNKGSSSFQQLTLSNERKVFEEVLIDHLIGAIQIIYVCYWSYQ